MISVETIIKFWKDHLGKHRLVKLKKILEKKDLSQEDIKKVYNQAKAPYFNISLREFNSNDPLNGSFELDYNIFFRNEIKKSNSFPPNMSVDDRIEFWFTEVCRQIAMETYENANETQLGYPGINMVPRDDGRIEYS